MAADPRQTPAMQQYYRFKRLHPECVLFFRIGDFYEMFDDDAVRVSKALGLTLTQRTEGVPMCGVPFHQLEVYLRRAIDAGFRVAVAEQVQDPKEAKGVIERAVTRVVTPGTLVDESLLRDDASSRLGAVCFLESGDRPRAAVAVADLSTGQFTVFESSYDALADELARRSVTELLYADTATGEPPPRIKTILTALSLAGTPQPAWHFRLAEARDALAQQFGVATLAGFGLAEDEPVVQPAGAVVRYLQQTQRSEETAGQPGSRRPTLAHLAPPRKEEPGGYLLIDATTLRSLEVLRTLRGGDVAGSLAGVFVDPGPAHGGGWGGCRTAMGRRLLRDWLCRPLADAAAITARQRAVSTLVEDRRTAAALAAALSQVQDVTRIAARLALARLTPRDLVALGRSLAQVGALHEAVENAPALAAYADALASVADALAPVAKQITEMCKDSPPQHLREGGLIRDGVDPELDEARRLQHEAGSWLSEYQARMIAEHNLPGIKVGYNKVFGYYIELTKAQARSAPASFVRKQTLTNAERYTTAELKEFEDKVTTAEARAIERETVLFNRLCDQAAAVIPAIGSFANVCAELDVLNCFAAKAAHRGWTCPQIVEEPVLEIMQGRHPVLDEILASGFVPNDVTLGRADDGGGKGPALALITGPNMAGKSTFIRQTALLVLLAHAGSFIPAERAVVGLTDRIFSRVGADDALHAGQSTFMVEMTETARILHHATPRSLIILDEIGRGTSTLDGLSLAWAIAEHLASPSGQEPGPRTLFATHYHELTDLEERLPGRVKNLHVAVREWGDSIVFLHRILPGRTDQSYGIHVAKLAGVPASVIDRARRVLDSLAVHHVDATPAGEAGPSPARRGKGSRLHVPRDVGNGQLSLFTEYLSHPAVDALREVKLDVMSPLEAFDLLRRLKDLAGSPQGDRTPAS